MKKLSSIILTVLLITISFSCGKQNSKTEQVGDSELSETTLPIVIAGDTLHIDYPYVVDMGDTVFQPIVRLKDSVIFDFQKERLIAHNRSKTKLIKHTSTTYILISTDGASSLDKWLILEVSGDDKITMHKDVLQEILDDIDGDGILEIGGINMLEAACVECDSVYYSPYYVYKLSETLTFDSISSKKLTQNTFGVFLGYKPLDTAVYLP